MGVIVSNCDGSDPTDVQIDDALRKKSDFLGKNAVPIGGNSSDIFCFNLALSLCDIAEENFINSSLHALELLWSIYPNGEGALAAQEIINSTTENLDEIHLRIILGEPIRIWYSNQPDEMCGLYWFMAQLSKSEMSIAQISTIKLPSWEVDGETVVQKTSWGRGCAWRMAHLYEFANTCACRLNAYLCALLANSSTPKFSSSRSAERKALQRTCCSL